MSMHSGWLVRGGKVLASAECAETFRDRLVGLMGRGGIDGVLVLRPARSIHTLGMRFPIDVAWCDSELRVLRVATVAPWRMTRPVRHTVLILEAEAGSFDYWNLQVGDQLALRVGGDQ